MHLVGSSDNKLLSIFKPIPTPNAVTNQVVSLLISPNNVNIGGSSRKNIVAVNSAVENEGTKESNRNIKVGLKVQPNMTTTASTSHWLTTATNTLVSVFFIVIFVCCQLASICSSKTLLSWVLIPFCMPCAKSIALSVKAFKNTQNLLIYEGYLAVVDLDNN